RNLKMESMVTFHAAPRAGAAFIVPRTRLHIDSNKIGGGVAKAEKKRENPLGPAVSRLAGATGGASRGRSFRGLDRPAGGGGAAPARPRHRATALSGAPGTRAGPHPAQYAPAGAGAVRGCWLDQSSSARSVAAA